MCLVTMMANIRAVDLMIRTLAILEDIIARAIGNITSHVMFFLFQAEDGIRDVAVTGVQTCALPIVECSERTDADGSQRRRLGNGWPQDLRSGWRGDYERARRSVPSRRGVRASHEFMDLTATDADAAAWHRRRGDRERISSRQRHDSVRWSVDVPRPASPNPHGTA